MCMQKSLPPAACMAKPGVSGVQLPSSGCACSLFCFVSQHAVLTCRETMPLSSFFNRHSDGSDAACGSVQGDEDCEFHDAGFREKVKKQKQTQKARQAALLTFAKRRFRKEFGLVPIRAIPSNPFEEKQRELQTNFFTGRLHYMSVFTKQFEQVSPDQKQNVQRNRARCAWSLLCALVNALEHVFAISSSASPKFVINTVIPDDTNTRLKGPAVGDKTVIYTVMNQMQNIIVHYGNEGVKTECPWHCLFLPCPVAILNAPNTEHLHSAYVSYMIAGASGIGKGLQRVGLKPVIAEKMQKAKWVVQIMTADAIETNASTFHVERVLLGHARQQDRACNRVAIRFKCLNHQLSLTRKPCVLAVDRFWSTLVRLAHLFECASFRRRFTAGILSLLKKPGAFQSIMEANL